MVDLTFKDKYVVYWWGGEKEFPYTVEGLYGAVEELSKHVGAAIYNPNQCDFATDTGWYPGLSEIEQELIELLGA